MAGGRSIAGVEGAIARVDSSRAMFETEGLFSGPNLTVAGGVSVLQRSMFVTLNKLPCFSQWPMV